jgi:hypothetical protein
VAITVEHPEPTAFRQGVYMPTSSFGGRARRSVPFEASCRRQLVELVDLARALSGDVEEALRQLDHVRP